MTSLALLAHSAAAPAGNSTFLTVAATIVPVLLLAVTIQGRTYQEMLALKISPAAAWLLTASVLSVGCLGEITALITLYTGTPATAPALIVLIVTVLLTLAIAGAALVMFMTAENQRKASARQQGEDERQQQAEITVGPIDERPGPAPRNPDKTGAP